MSQGENRKAALPTCGNIVTPRMRIPFFTTLKTLDLGKWATECTAFLTGARSRAAWKRLNRCGPRRPAMNEPVNESVGQEGPLGPGMGRFSAPDCCGRVRAVGSARMLCFGWDSKGPTCPDAGLLDIGARCARLRLACRRYRGTGERAPRPDMCDRLVAGQWIA